MSKITYSIASPYAITPQTNTAIGLYRHRSILPASDDDYLQIMPEYHIRPDNFAYDRYGDSALYWVFMVRNMDVIRDPLWGFTAGLWIYVPTKESLDKSLGL